MDTEKPCCLFFDYDGTVFVNHHFSPEMLNLMERVQKMGHRIILNTGRSHGGCSFLTNGECPIRWDGMICGGCDISYGDLHVSTTMKARDAARWMKYFLRRGTGVAFECERVDLSLRFSKEFPIKKQIRGLVRQGNTFLKQTDNPITKMTVYAKKELSEWRHFPHTPNYLLQQNGYYELYQNGKDKGSAIRQFCELTGTELSQCACFGDSMNDYEMFKAVPVSVAMHNSPEELKKLASYVAQGEDGVSEGLKWIFQESLDKSAGTVYDIDNETMGV